MDILFKVASTLVILGINFWTAAMMYMLWFD